MCGVIETSSICLIGGGGHALVVAEAAQLQGLVVEGFFDDRESGTLMQFVCERLGRCDEATSVDLAQIIAIGDIQLRRHFQTLAVEFNSVVHPSAIVSENAVLGVGCFVAAGSVVGCNANVGAHAIVNTRAIVEHDCNIDVNVHVGPGAVLGGGVRVGCHTLVGLNASVKPNVTIGDNCIVGAGAVVVHDVADDAVVIGVPARPISRRDFDQRRSA